MDRQRSCHWLAVQAKPEMQLPRLEEIIQRKMTDRRGFSSTSRKTKWTLTLFLWRKRW